MIQGFVKDQLYVILKFSHPIRHQGEGVTIENIASNALSTSEKALNLLRTTIDSENKVKDEIKELKKQYVVYSLLILLFVINLKGHIL